MAAAEARAAWQRAANRCFVQEDAKRAPKLAACQSSSSSSKQVDAGASYPADGPEHHPLGFMPFNRKPSYTDLPPDARWWLQMESSYGCQKGFTYEQLNTLAADKVTVKADIKKNDSEEVQSQNADSTHAVSYVDMGLSGDLNSKVSAASLNTHSEVKIEEPNAESGKLDQDFLDLKEMTDYYEYMEMELVGGSVSKRYNDLSFHSDSSWVEVDNVPWWRKTDKDELASLVAQKSVHHIENCDLPPPQKMRVRREPLKQPGCFGGKDEMFVSSHEWDFHTDTIFSPRTIDTPSSRGTRATDWGSSKTEGRTANTGPEHPREGASQKSSISDTNTSKAKLMEALCHSQTRARKAENAAKKAYEEKEHILMLFLRQASHLFAYKQLFRLLQLESYLLLKNREHASALFPILAPWETPIESGKQHRSFHRAPRARRRKREGRSRYNIGKYTVAFAVGLGLVGAGLLLGWTVGWLFPAF